MMTPELVKMLSDAVSRSYEMEAAAIALGNSLTAALPFKLGDVIAGIKVEKITFEKGCFMKGGKWQPGYRALGPIMISSSLPGSSRKSVCFDLQGFPANLTQGV